MERDGYQLPTLRTVVKDGARRVPVTQSYPHSGRLLRMERDGYQLPTLWTVDKDGARRVPVTHTLDGCKGWSKTGTSYPELHTPWTVVKGGARRVPVTQSYPHSGRSLRMERDGYQLPTLWTVAVHGGFGEWSPWGNCSATCEGQQQRQRLCNNPAPLNGGNDCVGQDTQTRACGQAHCPGLWA